MIHLVDIQLLTEEQAAQVTAWYLAAIKKPGHVLSFKEAAWVYGYEYNTIRFLACSGQLNTVDFNGQKRVTHGAMRAYIRNKRHAGRPRKACAEAQTQTTTTN